MVGCDNGEMNETLYSSYLIISVDITSEQWVIKNTNITIDANSLFIFLPLKIQYNY